MSHPRINSNIGTYLGQPIHKLLPGQKPIIGSMKVDTNNYQITVYDGKDWVSITDERVILSSDTTGFHVVEEEHLFAKHPGLADLRREADEAIARYETYYALCKE
jgi:hypothetical protein